MIIWDVYQKADWRLTHGLSLVSSRGGGAGADGREGGEGREVRREGEMVDGSLGREITRE